MVIMSQRLSAEIDKLPHSRNKEADELQALIFRLDLAETVEPLDEVAAALREEMLKGLEGRDE